MAEVKFVEVLEFTSEDPKYPASNLLSGGKWLGLKGISNEVTLKMEKCVVIDSVDIGNCGSALITLQVSRTGTNNFETLLPATIFMDRKNSKSHNKMTSVRMFSSGDFCEAIEVQKWNILRIICSQPFNINMQFGLSFVKVLTCQNAPSLKPSSSFCFSPSTSIVRTKGSSEESPLTRVQQLIKNATRAFKNESSDQNITNSPSLKIQGMSLKSPGTTPLIPSCSSDTDDEVQECVYEKQSPSCPKQRKYRETDVSDLRTRAVHRQESVPKGPNYDPDNGRRLIHPTAAAGPALLHVPARELQDKKVSKSNEVSVTRKAKEANTSNIENSLSTSVMTGTILNSPKKKQPRHNNNKISAICAERALARCNPKVSKRKLTYKGIEDQQSTYAVHDQNEYVQPSHISRSNSEDIQRKDLMNEQTNIEENTQISCPLCSNLFSKQEIEQHAAQCDPERSLNVECPVCYKNFPADIIERHAELCLGS